MCVENAGMTCGACVGNVKALLEHHPDVKTASVNLHTGTALVHVRVPEDVGKSKLPTVIEKIGEDLATVRVKQALFFFLLSNFDPISLMNFQLKTAV